MPNGEDFRPHAYRTGSVEFFLLPFRSDERALVPRFETESLVREALRQLREDGFDAVVDVGTGSGVIAVSLAKNFPRAKTLGIDVSEPALSLARENAARNGVEVEFALSDLLSGLPDWVGKRKNILFVANLPYVRNGDENLSEDTAFEPPVALYGGEGTGFELTERFLEQFEGFVRTHPNVAASVICEVGDDHHAQISAAALRFGREIRTFADPRGIHRFFTYRTWPS